MLPTFLTAVNAKKYLVWLWNSILNFIGLCGIGWAGILLSAPSFKGEPLLLCLGSRKNYMNGEESTSIGPWLLRGMTSHPRIFVTSHSHSGASWECRLLYSHHHIDSVSPFLPIGIYVYMENSPGSNSKIKDKLSRHFMRFHWLKGNLVWHVIINTA